MGTTRKPITPTSGVEGQIKKQVEGGSFTTERDLVRRDQEHSERLETLKAAIQAGLDSGPSDRTMDEIWAEFEQRHRLKGEVPPMPARGTRRCRHR